MVSFAAVTAPVVVSAFTHAIGLFPNEFMSLSTFRSRPAVFANEHDPEERVSSEPTCITFE